MNVLGNQNLFGGRRFHLQPLDAPAGLVGGPDPSGDSHCKLEDRHHPKFPVEKGRGRA